MLKKKRRKKKEKEKNVITLTHLHTFTYLKTRSTPTSLFKNQIKSFHFLLVKQENKESIHHMSTVSSPSHARVTSLLLFLKEVGIKNRSRKAKVESFLLTFF